jgi:predicted nucleotidyltransferase
MAKFLKSKEFVLLKRYFKKEPSVLLAFLFGSFAKKELKWRNPIKN